MVSQGLPSTTNQAQAQPKRRLAWLVGGILVLLIGAILRSFADQPVVADLRAWLPWFNQPTVTLYFPDATNKLLIPVTRPVATAEDLPQVALDELRRGPQADSPLRRALPVDLTVTLTAVAAGVAYVDLAGAAVTALDAQATAVAAQALEQTLLALPQLDQVVFTVDGRPWTALTDAKVEATARQDALLYYVYGDYLAPVTAALQGEGDLLQQVVQTYLQGPPAEQPLAGLPPDTHLLALTFNQENGLVSVNFSYTQAVRELALADPHQMRLLLTALIYTLTEQTGVKAVMLDFEGQSQLGLGQCSSLLRTPQIRPAILNDERLMQ